MLGAIRRSAVSHALRSSARTLSVRSAAQRIQPLSSSISQSPYASRSLFHSSSFRFSEVNAVAKDDGPGSEQGQSQPPTLFQDLADRSLVSRPIVETLTRKMKLETMTEVQRLTIPVSVTGADVLAQAKTGTGKTIAFLVPVMEKIANDSSVQRSSSSQRGPQRGSSYRDRFSRGGPRGAIDIRTIIISPTRELAEQIATEAKRLAQGTGLVVQTAVGGTQKRLNLQQMHQEGCHILVATPGRLKDVLSDPSTGVTAPKLSTLVLDEADRLLDEGFAPDLLELQHMLPEPTSVDRQTLMFSATVAPEVMGMVRRTMKPDFKFIKTVRDDEVPTHLSVPQNAVVLRGLENTFVTLFELSKRFIEDPSASRPFKAIVYFNSTKQVNLAYEAFERLANTPGNPRSGHPLGKMYLGEIHSQLTQAQRTRAANWFRKCLSGILFSSNVTARGMDFPDVTHVIQIGVPQGRDDYIHRLGRTARANKTGEGWILLHGGEVSEFKRLVQGIPFSVDKTSFPSASLDLSQDIDALTKSIEESSPELSKIAQQMAAALGELSAPQKAAACTAQMANMMGSFPNKRVLGEAIRSLAINGYGLSDMPHVSSRMSGNLGLNSENGFKVRSQRSFDSRDRKPSSPFGSRGGRGGGFSQSRAGPFRKRDDEGSFRPRGRSSGPPGNSERRSQSWF